MRCKRLYIIHELFVIHWRYQSIIIIFSLIGINLRLIIISLFLQLRLILISYLYLVFRVFKALVIDAGMIFEYFIFKWIAIYYWNFFICEWIVICEVSSWFYIVLFCLINALVLINDWSSWVFYWFYKLKFLLAICDNWGLA